MSICNVNVTKLVLLNLDTSGARLKYYMLYIFFDLFRRPQHFRENFAHLSMVSLNNMLNNSKKAWLRETFLLVLNP